MDDQLQPIIVKKKKAMHGGHHGGAWKVAYADFVTAMMALFIVLWLLSSDDKVKQAVGGYFQDPKGVGKMMGSTVAGAGEGLQLKPDDMKDLKEKIEAALKQTPEFQKLSKNIKITITAEGLRIELLEDETGMFFQSGSPKPSDMGEELIAKLAAELGKMPNKLFMEGHTDAKPFSSIVGYSNWELSSDRANAARRVMMAHGVRVDQVAQVRGFADQRLRLTNDPTQASNRRISVNVHYLNPPSGSWSEGTAADKLDKQATGGHEETKKEEGAHPKQDQGAPARKQ
jgi:chemotaxis protein MotB